MFSLFSLYAATIHGHPTTVLGKISVIRKQMLPRIFYYMRTAKNVLDDRPFMYNFRRSSNK